MSVPSVVLAQINIYPVKSCRGIPLQSAMLEDRGLQFDRRWMIVNEQNRLMTQRDMPQLALVGVDVQSDCLSLTSPKIDQLRVPLVLKNVKERTVTVWDDTVSALDAGDEPAEWFSRYLGVTARLVYMPDNADRVASRKGFSSQVSFADAYPLLLISEASLEDLNRRLDEPLLMNRFRPNLVVRGCEPYAEDSWENFMIGDVLMHGVKQCGRCVTTTVNQSTGEKDKEPLKTLATYRERDGNVLFGMNLIHEGRGELRVGSTVTIL